MKIELKSIKYSASQSEETNAFTAEVYIDGKKAAHARNSGNGDSTLIHPYEGFVEKVQEAAVFAKNLPSIGELKMDLEFFIDLKVEDFIEESRLKRLMTKSIVFKQKNGEIAYISYKGHTIANMLKSENGVNALKKLVNRLQSENSTILNTNIDAVLA